MARRLEHAPASEELPLYATALLGDLFAHGLTDADAPRVEQAIELCGRYLREWPKPADVIEALPDVDENDAPAAAFVHPRTVPTSTLAMLRQRIDANPEWQKRADETPRDYGQRMAAQCREMAQRAVRPLPYDKRMSLSGEPPPPPPKPPKPAPADRAANDLPGADDDAPEYPFNWPSPQPLDTDETPPPEPDDGVPDLFSDSDESDAGGPENDDLWQRYAQF